MIIATSKYELKFDQDNLALFFVAKGQHFYYLLAPFCDCDRLDGRDAVEDFDVERKDIDGVPTLIFCFKSRIWDAKRLVLSCHSSYLTARIELKGRGRITEVNFFNGRWRGDLIGSAPGFDEVFNPCVNFLEKSRFHSSENCLISAGQHKAYWSQAFAGAPFCFGLKNDRDGGWVCAGVAALPGAWSFDSFAHNPAYESDKLQEVTPGGFALRYDGKLNVDGDWTSPELIFLFAQNKVDCVKTYTRYLYAHGYLRRQRKTIPDWWLQPNFCTWREQMALSLMTRKRMNISDDDPTGKTSAFATRKNVDQWLDRLSRHGIKPGVIIIDAYWQIGRDYCQVDTAKWPDMRGFIDQCHANGQKVVLWMGVWARDNALDDECIMKDGEPVNIDPTHPVFQSKLAKTIRYLISDEPDCVNADGFKLDGVLRLPTGPGLTNHGDVWGLELQRLYHKFYHEEAKKHKEDALINVFALNPYLEDISDQVRLADMYVSKGDPESSMRLRADMVKASFIEDMPIDTDGQWSFDMRDNWLELFEIQAELGVPSLYSAEYVYRSRLFRPPIINELSERDYLYIKTVIDGYRERMGLEK